MSILVEIAGRADVSVEGVVRVLTREPVSSAVKERVLAVLDQLDAEQTRVLERFALAAVHDVVPLDAEGASDEDDADVPPSVHEGPLALGESPASGHPTFDSAENGAPATGGATELELPVGLGTLLEELVGAVWEIRHESRSNRQERLDDLAVLVDLMTTSWQGVDRRLARLEQLLARREARWQTPVPFPAQFERTASQPLIDAGPPPPAVPPADADAASKRWRRSWPPFAGTLILVLLLVGGLLVFDLLPSPAEGPTLPARETGTTGVGTQSTATGSSSTVGPSNGSGTGTQTTAPSTTGAAPQQAPPVQEPRGTTTGAARQAPPPAGTGTTPGTTPTTTGGSVIQPARVFVWPPVEGATGYTVRFFRQGEPFHTARVSGPRLAIPRSIVFTPGAYRWVVRPQTAGGLGNPIIDSTFSVAGP